MRPFSGHLRPATVILLFLILCLSIPGAGAWSVQNLAIKPAGGPVSPQTTVTVSYTVTMTSDWMGSGETFDSQHTLDMYTQLENGRWTASLDSIDEDTGTTTTDLGGRSGVRYRLDGWTLSYDDVDLDLHMTLTGTVPAVAQDMEKTIIQIRELDESGTAVGGGKTVKYLVAVPTTATTKPTPTPVQSPPETPAIPAPTTPPTVKQTYSPGPEPVAIVMLLAALGGFAAACRRWKRQ
jgi:hypothetical protein